MAGTTIDIDFVLSGEEIVEQMKAQSETLEGDVDNIIDDFLKTTNIQLGRNLLRGIEHFTDPEEGFAAWKKYYADTNEQDLVNAVKEQDVSFWDRQSLTWNVLKDSDEAQGKKTGLSGIFGRAVKTAISNVTVSLLANEFQTGLNFQQTAVMGHIAAPKQAVDGSLTQSKPFLKALMPHLKEAIESRFLGTLDELRENADKPLLDAELVRSFKDEVTKARKEQFVRLISQSFSSDATALTRTPLDFDTSQMPEDRTFGVEMEGFIPTDENFVAAGMKLTTIFNKVGLKTSIFSIMPKTKSTYEKWDTVFDASVINPLHFTGLQGKEKFKSLGLEIVSPILKGKEGARQVETAVTMLDYTSFKTNESCGMHVHVGLQDTTFEQRKNLVKALAANEDALDQLVEPGRRGTGNPYCKSIKTYDIAAVEAAQNDQDLVEAINPGTDRDHKFDITGMVRDGAPKTIQYRGEGGAGYMQSAKDLTILLVNFTDEALDNPDVTLEDVITRLNSEKPVTPTEPMVEVTRTAPQAAATPRP